MEAEEGETEDCPDDYFLASEGVCLRITQPSYNDRNYECRLHSHGKPFHGRPLTEEMSENLANEMQRQAEASSDLTHSYYIGFTRDDSPGGKMWIFTDNNEKIVETDYKLWAGKEEGKKCAVVSPQNETKVSTYNCEHKARYICEKTSNGCAGFDYYLDYKGFCLATYTDKHSYDTAKGKCPFGGDHLFSIRNQTQLDSAKILIYNFPFNNGIYVGLVKLSNGTWMYDDGQVETHGWAADSLNEFPCGAVRLLPNMTLGLYTLPCNTSRLWYLCEKSHSLGNIE